MVDLTGYYQNLLPIQYHAKFKAKGDIAIKSKVATGDWLMVDMWKNFDVDTAVGKQLDLIGKIVGLPRVVDGFDFFNKYYAYDKKADPMTDSQGRGFSDIGRPTEAKFKNIATSKSSKYSMNDEQYRLMIRLKILLNNAINTKEWIDNALFNIFGNNLYATDNLDMTMTFTVNSGYEFFAKLAKALNILPVPLGVSYNGID